MNPEGRDELPPVDAATDGEAMAQGSFGDPLLVGDLSPMARHRLLAQCSMGHKDDVQVDAPRRKHRLYSQTCLECQRNNDAVKMLLKDTIKIKRPISASLLFSRDFKKTAMENNDKRLSYKAAPPEARSAWEKLSEQESLLFIALKRETPSHGATSPQPPPSSPSGGWQLHAREMVGVHRSRRRPCSGGDVGCWLGGSTRGRSCRL